MRIREMSLGDVPEVHRIGSGTQEFSVSEESSCFWPREILENIVNSENDVALVLDDEKIAGYCIGTYHAPTRKATMENCWVSSEPKYRGNGRRLMDEAEDILREKGAKYFCAFVEEENQASINMCVKQGYTKGDKYHWMIKE